MKIASKDINENARTVTFHFTNGKKLVCAVDDLPDAIQNRYMLQGISTVIGNTYANADDNGWDIEDCRAEAESRWLTTVGGSWSLRGRGRVSRIVDAICEIYGREYEDVLESWSAMDKKTKKAVGEDPEVKKYLARKEIERADAQVSTIDVAKLFAKK